jgi:protein SCO1/2/putative membrane protein
MRRFLSAAVALALLGAAGRADAPAFDSLRVDDFGPVRPFTLTDQLGRTVRKDDLRGKVWVAQFFFTCCDQGCPVTTAAMADLYKRLEGVEGVALVSFSVYPEHDTPSLLRQYAEGWGADPGRWLFLTGEEGAVFKVSTESFKQAVVRNKESKRPGDAVGHTFALSVVDHEGNVRGYVNGKDRSEVERLAERVRELAEERDRRKAYEERPEAARYFPTINAGLNAACGVLLVLGWLAIRARMVLAHKALMLSALAVSAVFLGCYLYYHFVLLDGRPTLFTGEGPVRVVYLAVLLSHTVLAAVVAPLALTVTYLGLRDRLGGHVRLARWTLPLWLYVSVTGVVVYVMLYHLYPPW